MRLVIKCPQCRGPMWEEDLPDSKRTIDLACIICGFRKFYPRQKYLEWRKKQERNVNTAPAAG